MPQALTKDYTGAIRSVTIIPAGAPVANATAGAATLTAAELLSGVILRSGPGAGYIDTFPTAALIVAAIPQAKVGDSFDFTIVNGVAFANTVAAGVGVTLAGVTAITASLARKYRCTITAIGATPTVTITGIGEMTA